ncbi:hypothetical protein AB7M15_004969 [Bradyrhizobium ottawaense]
MGKGPPTEATLFLVTFRLVPKQLLAFGTSKDGNRPVQRTNYVNEVHGLMTSRASRQMLGFLLLLGHPRERSNSGIGFYAHGIGPTGDGELLERSPSASLWSEPVNLSWFKVEFLKQRLLLCSENRWYNFGRPAFGNSREY